MDMRSCIRTPIVNNISMKIFTLLFLIVLSTKGFPQHFDSKVAESPKNIILMTGDGMGYNHLLATYYYLYGTADSCVFSKHDFTNLAQATYPAQLVGGEIPTWSQGYNTGKNHKNPANLLKGATCSGSAATALATGKKTYNGSIGIGIFGDTLVNLVHAAKASGRSAGIVTSVQISHATPAGFAAHNKSRSNYENIAQQMILKASLDVLMGAGHPHYDNNGQAKNMSYRFVGGKELWSQLKSNPAPHIIYLDDHKTKLLNKKGQPNPWLIIEDSTAFAMLLEDNPPQRVLGIPKVHGTLQQARSVNKKSTMPFETPYISDIPSLDLMTRGALNVLQQNANGFFLMIEGGAIDWAGHSNQSDRMIEEMIDFLESVKSVIEWVEDYSSWDETLLIVTSDHECGFLWGEGGITAHFPIVNMGKGHIPKMQWYSTNHTNALVPLFAKGAGQELLELFADNYDPQHGAFLQNTNIAQTVFLLWCKPDYSGAAK